MPVKQLSIEDEVANQIRSRLKTLIKYRATSMALHGRSVESVHAYARSVNDMVNMILRDYPESREILRWARKFQEFVAQHDLLEPRVGD